MYLWFRDWFQLDTYTCFTFVYFDECCVKENIGTVQPVYSNTLWETKKIDFCWEMLLQND
jgi:hypothetical protein